MKYFKRLKLWKSANLDFNPETGLGHSYRWYEITKVIRGTLVLNNYRYSVTTARHVCKLSTLLNQLGMEYVSIAAPDGLQNLHSAANHVNLRIGRAIVENKYARIKNDDALASLLAERELIKKLGGRALITESEAIERAEKAREQRLCAAWERKMRAMGWERVA